MWDVIRVSPHWIVCADSVFLERDNSTRSALFALLHSLLTHTFHTHYTIHTILPQVTVLPRWGFYSFLLATMISLGLGHIILACHRLIIEPKVLPIPDDYCPRESLSSIVYEIHLNDRDVKFISNSSKIVLTANPNTVTTNTITAGTTDYDNTTSNTTYGENGQSEALLSPTTEAANEEVAQLNQAAAQQVHMSYLHPMYCYNP